MLNDLFLTIEQPLLSLFLGLLMLRFIMQLSHLNFRDNLGDFVVRLTNWLVQPLQKVVPNQKRYAWACLIAALGVAWLEVIVATLVMNDANTSSLGSGVLSGALLIAAARIINITIQLYIFVLFLQAILSWVNPIAPIAPVLNALSAPILEPIQRIVPRIGSIDISPLIAIIILQVLEKVVGQLFLNVI